VGLPESVADRLDLERGDRIGLVLGDGAHVTMKVAAINKTHGKYPALVVPAKLLPRSTASDPLRVDRWITFAVVGVIVAYAALSLINALVAVLSGRRGELQLLHFAGATRAQIKRMLELEALLIAAIGAIAGTAVAIAGLIPLAIATAGSPLPSGSPLIFAATIVLIAALVLIPTRIAFHYAR
jgi:putative ABC transport system permease protein